MFDQSMLSPTESTLSMWKSIHVFCCSVYKATSWWCWTSWLMLLFSLSGDKLVKAISWWSIRWDFRSLLKSMHKISQCLFVCFHVFSTQKESSNRFEMAVICIFVISVLFSKIQIKCPPQCFLIQFFAFFFYNNLTFFVQ